MRTWRRLAAFRSRTLAVAAARPVGEDAANAIRRVLPESHAPKVGIVLGSGMGNFADEYVTNRVEIPYADIPDFPSSTVSGHAGKLIVGEVNGVSVACLQGRVHLYEGIDPQQVRVPIYALKRIGCEGLILTTAVGSLREEVGPGELVAISDHINLQCRNPLIGPNDDTIGLRFPSMLDAYDPEYRATLQDIVKDTNRRRGNEDHVLRLAEGVYLAGLGPSFETPAEIRAYRVMGADVVGMSTVPEVICARHAGLRVAGIGVVVNHAAGMTDTHITHDETLHYAAVAGKNLSELISEFIERVF